MMLACQGPLRWEPLGSFLAARAIPGLESSVDGRFRRNVDGGWIEFGPAPPDGRSQGLLVTCSLPDPDDLASWLPTIRSVADLDSDLDAIAADLAGADPELGQRLASTPLPRLPGTFDGFELAVRAVVGQQVSVAAARTLLGRLLALAGCGDAFPTAATLADGDAIERLGMPQRRRATLQALAEVVASGDIDLTPSAEQAETRRRLLAIDGIGPWTAGYITMRALHDPDGWPTGDLGLRRSLGITAVELESRAERWAPWRAYAAMLLWCTDQHTPPE